uniref:Putative secreted protein n=1 Tax=Anopheles darlingi TaxID=43151 RepID=A0A2M4DBR5_ANODA
MFTRPSACTMVAGVCSAHPSPTSGADIRCLAQRMKPERGLSCRSGHGFPCTIHCHASCAPSRCHRRVAPAHIHCSVDRVRCT